MRALLDDPAALENDQPVHPPDRREPVRDDDGRPPRQQRPERVLNERLALRVERAGRLVQDEDRRVLQDRARDRHALALAARELDAALADERLVAGRQRLDELRRVGELRGALHFGVGRVGPSDTDVIGDAPVEHRRVLRHVADRRPKRACGDATMLCPPTRISPASTSAKRSSSRVSVVLPPPERPTRPDLLARARCRARSVEQQRLCGGVAEAARCAARRWRRRGANASTVPAHP